ncbi:hypothetical protein L3556_00500 [Candidatus Synechococcus calcipolaris G9]|uniref:Uncharacterized protein n=1 Tax=Candidatus Synechococcus calcipolaris G9 TaxID=1497997 RepID=A0ABT6EU42_9SYNE|nr:hypothetical protein [Candidatus Synechococcus calcipolaris]MDG2989417.1 hypothetical protein [Candidatus Synechococcus calcipolaris G9]
MSTSSSKSSLKNQSKLEFKEHLLARRLSRLPKEILVKFWEQDLDFSKIKSRDEIVSRVIFEYQIKNKNFEFVGKFKNFLRDAVLTAREADYLISLADPSSIVDWVRSWENNRFMGQNYTFYLHAIVELNQKYLEVNQPRSKGKESQTKIKQVSFPSQAIFLVGSRQEKKEELNGLEVVSFHPTTEFEIIIRKDLDILEIRGPYQVVRDFVSTAILDNDNPFSAARSYFIGEAEDAKKSLVKPIRQIVKIDSLKRALDGAYKRIASPFPGIKASMFEATLEDLRDLDEETNPEAKAILKELVKNPVKGNISFSYEQKKYSFSITKTGGLFFREYVPEEVVTYIVYLIKLSDNIQDGTQSG